MLYYLLFNGYSYFYLALIPKISCVQHLDDNLLAHRTINEKI